MKKQIPLNLAIIFTLIAVGVHAYLASHFYDLKLGTGTGSSFCNVNSYINCDAVTASKYSSVFGVPIAMFGVFTNLIAALFFIYSRFNLTSNSEKTARYAFILSSIIALTSLITGTISVTLIGNICLFCASAYILSFATWICSLKSTHIRGKLLIDDIKSVFTKEKWVIGHAVAIPVFAFVANSMAIDSRGFQNIDRVVQEKISYWQLAPTENFSSNGLTYYKGSGEPAVTIVEFADFRCPHCRDAYPALHAFAAAHPDTKLIFKTFPLDGTCNSAITGGDGISCALAFITQCSEKIAQKGWDAHNFIFENQETFRSLPLTEANEKVCKQLGTNCDEVLKCTQSDQTLQDIKSMAIEGEKAKIQGTPSVFVNGKPLSGGQLLPILEAAYKKAKAQ